MSSGFEKDWKEFMQYVKKKNEYNGHYSYEYFYDFLKAKELKKYEECLERLRAKSIIEPAKEFCMGHPYKASFGDMKRKHCHKCFDEIDSKRNYCKKCSDEQNKCQHCGRLQERWVLLSDVESELNPFVLIKRR